MQVTGHSTQCASKLNSNYLCSFGSSGQHLILLTHEQLTINAPKMHALSIGSNSSSSGDYNEYNATNYRHLLWYKHSDRQPSPAASIKGQLKPWHELTSSSRDGVRVISLKTKAMDQKKPTFNFPKTCPPRSRSDDFIGKHVHLMDRQVPATNKQRLTQAGIYSSVIFVNENENKNDEKREKNEFLNKN